MLVQGIWKYYFIDISIYQMSFNRSPMLFFFDGLSVLSIIYCAGQKMIRAKSDPSPFPKKGCDTLHGTPSDRIYKQGFEYILMTSVHAVVSVVCVSSSTQNTGARISPTSIRTRATYEKERLGTVSGIRVVKPQRTSWSNPRQKRRLLFNRVRD